MLFLADFAAPATFPAREFANREKLRVRKHAILEAIQIQTVAAARTDALLDRR